MCARQRKYYRENKEKENERNRKYGKKNRARYRKYHREYNKKWQRENPAKSREYARRWRERHPERAKKSALNTNRRRRAQKLGSRGRISSQQWSSLKEKFGGKCAYCDKALQKFTQDHVVPLSLRGEHTMGNIVPACRPCNSGKRDRVWYPNYPKGFKYDKPEGDTQ